MGSAARRRVGPQIDPEGEDPVLDAGLGVAEHGEVHEVGLSLLFEPLAIGTLDGGEAPGFHRIGPGPEALHHGLGVELIGHGPMVPAEAVCHE
jgi:hypothetical protein